jgi:hypothetical protein
MGCLLGVSGGVWLIVKLMNYLEGGAGTYPRQDPREELAHTVHDQNNRTLSCGIVALGTIGA